MIYNNKFQGTETYNNKIKELSIVLISMTNVTKLTREELPSHPWPHPWEVPHLSGSSFVWIFHPLVFHLSVQPISGYELSVQWVFMPA